MKKSTKVFLIVLLVLIIDQALKIYIKTDFYYGETRNLFGDWGRLHFVENPGMAFGWELGGEWGKLILSSFRILAVGFLIYFINMLIKSGANMGLLACFAFILAGAIGNILDSAFYGLIFTESTPHTPPIVAKFTEFGKGYEGFLKGRVVDMLYFPMIENATLPEWIPRWGGEKFTFFRPVFNIADASITVGVASLLLFQRSFFSEQMNGEESNKITEETMEMDEEKEVLS